MFTIRWKACYMQANSTRIFFFNLITGISHKHLVCLFVKPYSMGNTIHGIRKKKSASRIIEGETYLFAGPSRWIKPILGLTRNPKIRCRGSPSAPNAVPKVRA